MSPQSEPTAVRLSRRVVLRTIAITLAAVVGLGVGSWVVGWGIAVVIVDDMPKWAFARASGVTSYLLLCLVTGLGILLSHPRRAHWRWLSIALRLRLHIAASVLAILFTVGHLVILALDDYADVGWVGALIPFAASYRPIATALGVLAFWSISVSAITAALAGRRPVAKVWWPLHKIAAGAFILSWAHAVLAGTDVVVLLGLYVSTGALIGALAVWRYTARTVRDDKRVVARASRTADLSEASSTRTDRS
jgi:DMSO/TMAO reductase YedYZ heme-binding membrane subunit